MLIFYGINCAMHIYLTEQSAKTMLYTILIGILMGISMAAPPGPINAMMSEATRSNFRGSLVGLGAMTADAIYSVIMLVIKGFIPHSVIHILYFAGSALMLYFSIDLIKAKYNRTRASRNYLSGLLTGLMNPYQISWWITFGTAMLYKFGIDILVGFFVSIIIWLATFPYIIERFVSSKFVFYINIFSSIILLVFGLFMIYEGLKLVIQF